MTLNDTFSTTPGKYTGYVQFNGNNNLQDVYWNPTDKCLDTPYDDAIIPDVCPNVWNPASIKLEFENLVHTMRYSDDVLIPVTMTVTEPVIVIADIMQGDTTLQIFGTTSWSDGTELVMRLDPDNYALPRDIQTHTWKTYITGNLQESRVFATTLNLDTTELYLGTHEIEMSVTKNKYVTTVYHNFRVSGIYVMPTPTPKFEKVILNMNGTRIATATPTIIQTSTPTPSPTFNPLTQTDTQNVTPVERVTRPAEKPITMVGATEAIPVQTVPTTDVVNVGMGMYGAVAALAVIILRKQ